MSLFGSDLPPSAQSLNPSGDYFILVTLKHKIINTFTCVLSVINYIYMIFSKSVVLIKVTFHSSCLSEESKVTFDPVWSHIFTSLWFLSLFEADEGFQSSSGSEVFRQTNGADVSSSSTLSQSETSQRNAEFNRKLLYPLFLLEWISCLCLRRFQIKTSWTINTGGI